MTCALPRGKTYPKVASGTTAAGTWSPGRGRSQPLWERTPTSVGTGFSAQLLQRTLTSKVWLEGELRSAVVRPVSPSVSLFSKQTTSFQLPRTSRFPHTDVPPFPQHGGSAPTPGSSLGCATTPARPISTSLTCLGPIHPRRSRESGAPRRTGILACASDITAGEAQMRSSPPPLSHRLPTRPVGRTAD